MVGIRRNPLLAGFADRPSRIEGSLQLRYGRGVGQIALVVLDGEWNLGDVVPVLGHVLVEILHCLDVGVHALDLAVGDEHDAIHALQDQLARGIVVYLARHGVQVELDLEPTDVPEIYREEVEEQRSFGLGGKRDHLAPGGRGNLVVDVLQVGSLPAQSRPVVHQLAVDLPGGVVDHRHGEFPQDPKSLSISSSASPRNSDSTPGALVPSRLNLSVNTCVSCATAAFTRSFTRPSVVRLSKRTTRMTRRAMSARYIDSRSPWWKSAPNSDSPSIRAS